MLQSLNNLHVLSECHKTRIEIQHSLHVLDELLDVLHEPSRWCAIDETMVVSEMGEQWSPNTPPPMVAATTR